MAGVIVPKLYGRFNVASSSAFNVEEDGGTNTAITITTGDYFIRSHTASPSDSTQLLEHIQARVRAVPPFTEMDTFTATISNTTGLVTFATDPAALGFEIFWNNTTLRNLLGFTGDLTPPARTFTATNQAKYTWHPNTGVEALAAHPNVQGHRTSDAVVHRAPSGRVITTAYDEYIGNQISFRWIEDQYMFPVGSGGVTVVNRDFEQFWRDIFRIGQRFRFFPDRTSQTAPGGGAPWEYVGGEDICAKGTMLAKPERPDYAKFWQIPLDVMEYVA